MSHLNKHNTDINNLVFLTNALDRINVPYDVAGQDIVLTQSNGKNAAFIWDGENYTLVYDVDYWLQSLTVNSFTEKVTREYSAEKIVNSMNSFGFNIESYENFSPSNTYQTIKSKILTLSRYFV